MTKQKDKILVECVKCKYCPGKVENFMVDCSNKDRNPRGYKIGNWKKQCDYYKARARG